MQQFNEGDVVRYKSETQPMTVLWQSVEYKVPTVCCTFFDNEKKEQIIKTRPDTLELVPAKALRRLQQKKNQTGLKSLFENHPVPVYISIGVVAFVAGFGVPGILQKNANQELVTKGTYLLTSEIQETVGKNYIEKKQYEAVVKENTDLKSAVARSLQNSKSNEVLKQVSVITEKRDRIQNSLGDIRARNSPIVWSDPSKPIPTSKEEQDALDQISQLNVEISVLLGKL
jgi:hypothetical protein